MKTIFIFPSLLILMSFTNWQTNFDTAKLLAQNEHKLILLNFSGSDWCGPCIMFRKDVIENEAFQKFADSTLILVNADFPRQKKNQLSKEQQIQNRILADKYNSKGIFPMTLLLTQDGNVLKKWEGKPKEKTTEFITEIKAILASGK